jgi:hypothetical protein
MKLQPLIVLLLATLLSRSPSGAAPVGPPLWNGKLTGLVDPAKNRALTSGLHSWDGGRVTRVTPGAKLESHYPLIG